MAHMYRDPLPSPPRPRGTSPRLATLHEVEGILRRAARRDEGPLSLAEIGKRMRAKEVRHATLRACVNELKRLSLVAEDPRRGIMWVHAADPALWSRAGWRRL